MHINSKINNIQQNRIKHHAQITNGNKFLDLLAHPQLFTVIEESLPVHRDRCFAGFTTRTDMLGVSSMIRSLGLHARYYDELLSVNSKTVNRE